MSFLRRSTSYALRSSGASRQLEQMSSNSCCRRHISARSFSEKRLQSPRNATSKKLYVNSSDAFDFGSYTRSGAAQVIPEDVARRTPSLMALHSRLELSPTVAYSTLARALISAGAKLKYLDNIGMAVFGKNLMSYYVHEHFMIKYPRLPPTVLKRVIELYTDVPALAKIGSSWGVEADSRSPFIRYLADQEDEDLLGKLVFTERVVDRETGVKEILNDKDDTYMDFNGAMAEFVRALVAGVYAHEGMAEARNFIHKYIIQPNKLDISQILSFEKPTRELTTLCSREGMESPISRLLAETGRFTHAPVYVVGVFSGPMKLGEGQGSSLREARVRAAVHSLKSWYLYSPVDAQLPSEDSPDYMPAFVDSGVVII